MAVGIATYNLHGCVGMDGRFDPERVLAVLRELDAEVLALQELHWDPGDTPHLLEHYARALGCQAVPGPTLMRRSGHYGNALLTRLAVRNARSIDLSVPGHEPRGALDVVLEGPDGPFRALATHLGLRPAERRWQVKRLLGYLADTELELPAALMGDINEWFLWGRPLRWLHRHFAPAPAPATFPAAWPLLALDRIWAKPLRGLTATRAHASPLARRASDHLPLRAVLALG